MTINLEVHWGYRVLTHIQMEASPWDDIFQLVGGDWNHGMDYDFPFSWEFHHPNSYFSEGLKPPTSHHEGLTFTMKSWGFTGLAHLEEGLSSKSRRVEVTPVWSKWSALMVGPHKLLLQSIIYYYYHYYYYYYYYFFFNYCYYLLLFLLSLSLFLLSLSSLLLSLLL